MTTVDLADVRADDALLDALGGRDGEQPDALADDGLNALLLEWRRTVDAAPASVLVDVDTAAAVIAEHRRPVDLLPDWAHTLIYVGELALTVAVFLVLPLAVAIAQAVIR